MSRSLVIVLFLLLETTTPLFAHPHVFLENSVIFEFDQNGLAGFTQAWVFDEMTSSTFLMDYDTDKDGSLSDNEVKALKAGVFDNLKNYHYMTWVEIDGKAFSVSYVKDFHAKIKDSVLVYEFFVPCHVRAGPNKKEIRLSVFDDDYFIDFKLNSREIKLKNGNDFETELKIQKNLKKTFYMGQLNPIEINFTFKNKD